MKKAVLLAFVLVLSSMFGTKFVITINGSTTHDVYPGESIQETINLAQSGDTVFVHSGTYYEHVVADKTLLLVGEDRETTIIDGNMSGTVVKVTASSVLITNLTIQNSGNISGGITHFPDGRIIVSPSDSGIIINNVSDCKLMNNVLTKNLVGIYLLYATGNTIVENNIRENNYAGVELGLSYFNIISGNNITTNGMTGIYFWNSSDNYTYGNSITNNSHIGIMLSDYSTNNAISGNNIVTNNDNGIWFNFSSNNSIYHNNFMGNPEQVDTYGSTNVWDDDYPSGGNYWSDYTGVDIYSGLYQNESDHDWIGDSPYFINQVTKDNYPLIEPYDPKIHETQVTVIYQRFLERYYELSPIFNNLTSTYNDLKSKQEATISELNYIRNLMYIFIGATIIFIATTVYLLVRKTKALPSSIFEV